MPYEMLTWPMPWVLTLRVVIHYRTCLVTRRLPSVPWRMTFSWAPRVEVERGDASGYALGLAVRGRCLPPCLWYVRTYLGRRDIAGVLGSYGYP